MGFLEDEAWAAEMKRLANRIEVVSQQLDDHRSECTSCLIGKSCRVGKGLFADMQALNERLDELSKR